MAKSKYSYRNTTYRSTSGGKKSTKSRTGAGAYLSLYGVPDMLDRIEKALGDPKKALAQAYRRGMDQPETVMEDWFEYLHHRTGRTREAYKRGELVWTSDNYATYRYGYHKEKGGLTALFFEYGTPRIKPEFVMYHAVHGAIDVIESEIEAELADQLRKQRLVR